MSKMVHPALFAGWIDDAAVFPPGSSPIPGAWLEHHALRAGPYADLIGPLLIPSSGARELVGFAEAQHCARSPGVTGPMDVSVIAGPGTPVQDLLEAVRTLRDCGAVRLVGIEMRHDPEEPESLAAVLGLGLRTAVEVTRDVSPSTMLELAENADRQGRAQVIAKLRTQPTAQAPPPTAGQVATFLINAHRVGLPVKFTGGLHRALRHGVGTTAEHGCLNVLVAVATVVEGIDGEDHPFVVDVLEQRDADPLVEAVFAWTRPQVGRIRAAFPSFGCCGVHDPIGDLVALGVLSRAPGDAGGWARTGTDHEPSHADPARRVGT